MSIAEPSSVLSPSMVKPGDPVNCRWAGGDPEPVFLLIDEEGREVVSLKGRHVEDGIVVFNIPPTFQLGCYDVFSENRAGRLKLGELVVCLQSDREAADVFFAALDRWNTAEECRERGDSRSARRFFTEAGIYYLKAGRPDLAANAWSKLSSSVSQELEVAAPAIDEVGARARRYLSDLEFLAEVIAEQFHSGETSVGNELLGAATAALSPDEGAALAATVHGYVIWPEPTIFLEEDESAKSPAEVEEGLMVLADW